MLGTALVREGIDGLELAVAAGSILASRREPALLNELLDCFADRAWFASVNQEHTVRVKAYITIRERGERCVELASEMLHERALKLLPFAVAQAVITGERDKLSAQEVFPAEVGVVAELLDGAGKPKFPIQVINEFVL